MFDNPVGMEYVSNMKNLPEIAQQIATQLGCTVKPGDNEYCQEVVGAETPFYIYAGYGTNKLGINLSYPRTADGTQITRTCVYPTLTCPNINVSASRTPAAIAADIKRRFIPAAKLVYAACLERVKQYDEYGVTCLENARDIARACTVATVRQDSPNQHATVSVEVAGLTGKVEVLRDNGTLTLRGSVDDIVKALAAIGKV